MKPTSLAIIALSLFALIRCGGDVSTDPGSTSASGSAGAGGTSGTSGNAGSAGAGASGAAGTGGQGAQAGDAGSAGSGGTLIGGAAGSAGDAGSSGSAGTSGGGTAGSAGSSGSAGSAGSAGATCIATPLVIDANGLRLGSANGTTRTSYYAKFAPPLGGPEPDYLFLRFVGAPADIPVGTYDLGNTPYNQASTSPIEVLVAEDFANGVYNRLYFQSAGTLDLLVADSDALGSSKGTLSNINLVEVTLSGNHSTPVPDGACLGIANLSWDTTGGVCGTGFPIENPTSQACFEQNCCGPFVTCVEDDTCAACYATPNTPECQANALYQASSSCFVDQCTSPVCDSGLIVQKPACASCLTTNCCSVATACGNDPDCKTCWFNAGQGAGCTSNAHLIAAATCLQTSCGQECQ